MRKSELMELYQECKDPKPKFTEVWEAYKKGLVIARRHTSFSRGCDGSEFRPGDVTFHCYSDALPDWITN